MLPEILIIGSRDCLWTYTGQDGQSVEVRPPVICLDGKETTLYGKLELHSERSVNSTICERRYIFSGRGRLTRPDGKDVLVLACLKIASQAATEVRLSDYSSLYHGYMPTEVALRAHDFNNGTLAMGPILTWPAASTAGFSQTLLAYEHGSQWPDAYLGFQLDNGTISIVGLKGVYDSNHSLSDPFESVWLHLVAIPGTIADIRHCYRTFINERLCPYPISRQPKVYYNTWHNQERVHGWYQGRFLTAMNERQILSEIDVAARMGVDTYVLDVGWFGSTGDWSPSKDRFPRGLKPIKESLGSHNMDLGLWFGPTTAALSSSLYKRNVGNRMTWRDQPLGTREVWETEESAECCLVSSYADDFADELIRCARDYGVTYFKWDAVEQYGCDDYRHFHGDNTMTHSERADRYAFLQPIYMTRIVQKLQAAVPNATVDFDVTESARCVGLAFLSVGRYFAVNNGPYYQEFDVPNDMTSTYLPHVSVREDGVKFGTTYENTNLFFHPGPARNWVCRSGLEYDRWIPSTLFLVHYLPDDEPSNNQLNSIASLVLGHGGIWGDITGVSTEGQQTFRKALSLYKKVRDFSTRVGLERVGQPGGMVETYDKVDPKSGQGLVVLFTGRKLEKFWAGAHDVGILPASATLTTRATSVCARHKILSTKRSCVDVKFDRDGRATVSLRSTEITAAVVFFGSDV